MCFSLSKNPVGPNTAVILSSDRQEVRKIWRHGPKVTISRRLWDTKTSISAATLINLTCSRAVTIQIKRRVHRRILVSMRTPVYISEIIRAWPASALLPIRATSLEISNRINSLNHWLTIRPCDVAEKIWDQVVALFNHSNKAYIEKAQWANWMVTIIPVPGKELKWVVATNKLILVLYSELTQSTHPMPTYPPNFNFMVAQKTYRPQTNRKWTRSITIIEQIQTHRRVIITMEALQQQIRQWSPMQLMWVSFQAGLSLSKWPNSLMDRIGLEACLTLASVDFQNHKPIKCTNLQA